MTKLDTTIKYSILYLQSLGKSVKDIAKELNISQADVKSTIEQNTNKSESKIKTTSAPVNSKDLMITETSAKGTKSVAIMTKAASEVNDAFRSNMDQRDLSRTARDAIYRPNPNKK
jgi:predicted transcriptional regulator